jgi:NSS family neurotransmitter:Na+ symporter
MERWSSRAGFLVAAIGAAVGLGDVWLFPVVVGRTGGGAYLLPYFVAAFVIAAPLVTLEFSVGRTFRGDVVSSFSAVRPAFESFGWVVAGVAVLVASYYLVLTGGVLAALAASASGVEHSLAWFTGSYWPLAAFALTTALAGGVLALGVRGGVERLSRIAIPLAVFLLVVIGAYATGLDGFDAGLSFFLEPDVAVLTDPLVWSSAFGHALFSLVVGRGVMLTYGSYLTEGTDLLGASLLVTVSDIGVGVLAGLILFPILFTARLDPTIGPELVFSTLPRAFASVPMGETVAVAFFGALFLVSLTSAVALLEVGVAATMSATAQSRPAAAGTLVAVAFVVGLPSALSYSAVNLRAFGAPALYLLDGTIGTYAPPLIALGIAAVFAWLREPVSLEAVVSTPLFRPHVKFVVPAVLLIATGAGVAYGVDVPGWRLLPGTQFGGRAAQLLVSALLLTALYLVGRAIAAYRIRRRASRRREGG